MQSCEQLVNKDKFLDFTNVKVKKIGKDRGFVGPVSFNFPIDNNYTVEGKLYMKQGGEYREMPYKLQKKPFCDFVNGETFFLPKVTDVTSPPMTFPMSCPSPVVRKSSKNNFKMKLTFKFYR